MKVLALPQVPEGSAYNIMLKAPVGSQGDLQGRKIRATQTYAGVLSMLGASPVNLPPAEIYPSLEKGVVDGAAWPVIGPLGYRWYEVAKYILRPSFGVVVNSILMSTAGWNSPDRRSAQDLGRRSAQGRGCMVCGLAETRQGRRRCPAGEGRAADRDGSDAEGKGCRTPGPAGVLEFTLSRNQKDISELRDLAKSKGLLK